MNILASVTNVSFGRGPGPDVPAPTDVALAFIAWKQALIPARAHLDPGADAIRAEFDARKALIKLLMPHRGTRCVCEGFRVWIDPWEWSPFEFRAEAL